MATKHQDYIYLKEDYYKTPKETFKFLGKLILKDIYNGLKNPLLLDIGCARGEFLNYMTDFINPNNLFGIDYSSDLINEANQYQGLNGVNFSVGSAETFELDNSFDVITMSGVLSYFDNPLLSLRQISKHLKPGGVALIFGFFNDYNVDVRIQYRNNNYFSEFENGWNLHSIDTINKYLSEVGMVLNGIEIFELSFNQLRQEDPCRSWNIETSEGRKFTNGIGLIYDMRVLKISKL